MTQTRKLLTLLALVAFVVIIFTVGYHQSPYSDLQLEWGRGRVWGLTTLGNALVILAVIYAGLFAIGSDDKFLTRHRRGLKRLVIVLVALCVLAGGIVALDAIMDETRRISKRNAMLAEEQRQRQAARADWEKLTPPECGYFKFLVGLPDKGSMTDREKARLQAFSDFVPEIHQSLSEQEKAGLEPQDIFDRVDARPPWEIAKDAQADWKAMTAKERREMKVAVRLGLIPESPKERQRMETLKDFVPEVYQPETEEEKKTHP